MKTKVMPLIAFVLMTFSLSSLAETCTFSCKYISLTDVLGKELATVSSNSFQGAIEDCKGLVRNELNLVDSEELFVQDKDFMNRKEQNVFIENLSNGAIYVWPIIEKSFYDRNGYPTGKYFGLATRENSCNL